MWTPSPVISTCSLQNPKATQLLDAGSLITFAALEIPVAVTAEHDIGIHKNGYFQKLGVLLCGGHDGEDSIIWCLHSGLSCLESPIWRVVGHRAQY